MTTKFKTKTFEYKRSQIKKNVPIGYRIVRSGEEILPGDLVGYGMPHKLYPLSWWASNDAFKMWAYDTPGTLISALDDLRVLRPEPLCPCDKHEIDPNEDINKQHREWLIKEGVETNQAYYDTEIKIKADIIWEDS